jgi:hypothetical protein
MNLLRDLSESRLYKRLGQIEGMNIHAIAERLFEHLLALQILVHEDPVFAKKLATQLMKQQHFDGFRTSQSDLFNLISLVLNQETYSHLIGVDSSVGIPELRLKRNLRDISNGKFSNNDYSNMMYLIQQRFKKLPDSLFALRRQTSDYKRLSKSNKTMLIKRLRLQMREQGIQSELFQALGSALEKLDR